MLRTEKLCFVQRKYALYTENMLRTQKLWLVQRNYAPYIRFLLGFLKKSLALSGIK